MENKSFIVSARKYRPQTFESVVGQKAITKTLKNAIKTKQLAHAYLFCGPRGVGKTTCARIFAKTINCMNLQENGEACNECESCKSFNTGRSLNIHELDAASNNSVEDIRNLIDQVRIPPQLGKYSVYIIDEVHMLSQAAFNAFLKTLEEPPKHALFILATTEKHKILPTILSRCQIYDFQRIKLNDISEHLSYIAKTEEIEAEPKALAVIAQKADGGLRDALSIFDQIVSFSFGKITYSLVLDSLNVLDYDYYFKFVELFLANQYNEILVLLDSILQKGFETQTIIAGLANHFRDLLVSQHEKSVELLQVSDDIKQMYFQQAQKTKPVYIIKSLDLIAKADTEHRLSQHKRLHLEILLLQLCQLADFIYHPQQQVVQNNQQTQTQTVVQNATQPIQNQQSVQQETKNNIIEQQKTQIPVVSSILKNGITPKIETNQNTEQPKAQEKQIKEVSIEEIKPVWTEYAEKIKEYHPRTYAVMSDYQIQLENQTIILSVLNEAQKDKLITQVQDILNFINNKLSTKLDLKIIVTPTASTKKIVYTDEQKYEFLKNKNPKLDDFKNQLKLDF